MYPKINPYAQGFWQKKVSDCVMEYGREIFLESLLTEPRKDRAGIAHELVQTRKNSATKGQETKLMKVTFLAGAKSENDILLTAMLRKEW